MFSSVLPDITWLRTVKQATWRELSVCLRTAGLGGDCREPLGASGRGGLESSLNRPLQRWHCRQVDSKQARALRLFVLSDPVPACEAKELLGERLFAVLLDAGLLTPAASGHVVSAFPLRMYRGLLLLSDELAHGGDAVFAVGPGTSAFVLPATGVLRRNALDLGCGAGAVAMWLAQYVPRVVAADINPRALAFTEINALLNGIENIEVRCGDLYDAVDGECFDLIMSQPPFVPCLPEAETATYLHGGASGGEIVQQVLQGLPRHLTACGRAQIVFDHATDPDVNVSHHALPFDEPMRSLLLLGAPADSDSYSVRQTAALLKGGSAHYEPAVTAMRMHLHKMNIRSVFPGILIVEHAEAGPGWTEVARVGTTLWDEVSTASIDKLFAAHHLLHQGLRPGKFRVLIPEDCLIIRRFGDSGDTDSELHLALPHRYVFSKLQLKVSDWMILQALHAGQLVNAPAELLEQATRAGLIDTV